MAKRQDDDKPRDESATSPAAGWGVPQTFSLQSIVDSMKWPGSDAGAEVLYRAFLAEQDGRRFLVRIWLEVYRQIVEEDRVAGETKSGSQPGGRDDGT